ncbi:MAG: glycosyltransferase family 4 protein [Thiolinea sp.]
MKIAFIAIKGIDVIGGIETYTIELGKRLAESGHEVIVYCMKSKTHTEPFRHAGILFYPLPTIRHKYLEKITLVFLATLHQFKIPGLDIVHYHAVGPSIFSFIPRLFGRYAVFQSHGHEWERDSWNVIARVFFRVSESMTFLFANDSSAVSKNLKDYYEKKYKKSVTYIPSGITPRAPRKLQQNIQHDVQRHGYFLYVGRLSKEKRIEDLINAYRHIKTNQLKLVIVGKERPQDKEYVSELKQLSQHDDNIIFTGAAYGDELVEWYSNALAYILPSAIEGLPITLLEAMSFSRCCIASDIPANSEALDNKGFTYPLGDVEALKKHMEYVINHPDIAQTKGDMLLRHAYDNYTWPHITEQFIRFYNKKHPGKLQADVVSEA